MYSYNILRYIIVETLTARTNILPIGHDILRRLPNNVV